MHHRPVLQDNSQSEPISSLKKTLRGVTGEPVCPLASG